MELSFTEAILDATSILLERHPNTILFGLGVNDDRGLQGTTKDLVKKFGDSRVFDIPIAEDAMMGFAVGSAMGGVRTIFNHARMDFLLLTFNQLFNVAAKYNYMFDGETKVPLIVRCLVGYGWGAQHSQVLTNVLSAFPGVSVICPSTPSDAKGLLLEATTKDHPVIFVEDFQLYSMKEEVTKGYYRVEFNEVKKLLDGDYATLVTISSAVLIVKELINSRKLKDIDVLCLQSVTDIDYNEIEESVKKTGRLLFIQNSWMEFGLGANIARKMLLRGLQFTYSEVGFPFTPTPYAPNLELDFYVSKQRVLKAVDDLIRN